MYSIFVNESSEHKSHSECIDVLLNKKCLTNLMKFFSFALMTKYITKIMIWLVCYEQDDSKTWWC